jgi:hypothetical protein
MDTILEYNSDWEEDRGSEPQAIGEILAELLAEYERRYPEVNVTVIEVPAAA